MKEKKTGVKGRGVKGEGKGEKEGSNPLEQKLWLRP